MLIQIREAQAMDAAGLIRQISEISREPEPSIPVGPGEFSLTIPEEEAYIREHREADNSLLLVAEHEGKILGALGLDGGQRAATRHTAVLWILVHQDWRDRGLGHALMERALDWARTGGILQRISLSVFASNARAIHLYETFGFTIEGRHSRAFFLRGEYADDLTMALWLE